MRAKEFISEQYRASVPSGFAKANPGLVSPTDREELYVSRYYDFYRISTLTGLSEEDLEKTDVLSYLGNLPMYSSYTKEDHAKLTRALKKLGLNPKDYIPSGSTEQADTNNESPVKPFKGYKR